MHDCRQTEIQLIDLVFDEAAGAHALLAEISDCPACLAQYQAMMVTLRAFDQAAEAMQPAETYWAGYEARLRAKLTEAPPTMRERLAGLLAALFAKPLIPAVVGAALLLLIVASFIWQSQRRSTTDNPAVVKVTPSPQPAQTPAAPESTVAQQPSPPELRPQKPVTSTSARRVPRVRESERRVEMNAPDNLLAADSSQPVLPALAPERHFERAQLLLRAFRNSRFDEGTDAPDLAYEKRKSRELVYDNILLRREAAAKGNVPVEDVLSSLEPLLLDIANLPDKPAPEAVQAIRERVQKTEIVATLQIYSSSLTRPGELNQ